MFVKSKGSSLRKKEVLQASWQNLRITSSPIEPIVYSISFTALTSSRREYGEMRVYEVNTKSVALRSSASIPGCRVFIAATNRANVCIVGVSCSFTTSSASFALDINVSRLQNIELTLQSLKLTPKTTRSISLAPIAKVHQIPLVSSMLRSFVQGIRYHIQQSRRLDLAYHRFVDSKW